LTATAKIDIDFSDAQNRFNVERKLPTSPDDLSNAKIGSMLAGNAAVRYLLLMDSAFVQYELISGIQKSGTVQRDSRHYGIISAVRTYVLTEKD